MVFLLLEDCRHIGKFGVGGEKSRVELGVAGEFDHVIVNDTVSRATDELEGLMGLTG